MWRNQPLCSCTIIYTVWQAVLSLFLALQSTSASAQSPRYLHEVFGTRNGLLSPKIYSLAQTTDRRLWIGSELGLSVFNGYTFSNYQFSSGNEVIGRILAIAQDSTEGVWVGGDKGLFYFRNDSLHKIDFGKGPSLAIESLLTDAKGNLWVGDLHFVYCLTPQQAKQVLQTPNRKILVTPFAGLKERAFGLALDRLGNVYMASHGGVYLFHPEKNSYSLLWKNPDVNNYVRSVSALSTDSIFWNRSDGHPSYLIQGKEHEFYSRDFLGRYVFNHNNKIYAVTTRDISLMENEIKPLVNFSGLTNHAHAVLIDAEENIWIGSWEGLHKFRRTPFSVYHLPIEDHSETFSFIEKRDGEILFGGNRGLLFRKQVDLIKKVMDAPRLFKNAEVLCMYEAPDGSLWCGSGYEGITRLKDNKTSNWNKTGFLKDNNCEALFPLENGKLFACTELGVTLVDPAASEPMIAHYDFEKKYSRHPELFGAFYSPGNGYWFYGSQGIYKLAGDQLRDDSIAGMPVKNIYTNKIVADKRGNIWVATQGKGLLLCTIENGSLKLEKQFDSQAGLPSDYALSVLVDKNNHTWCADYMSLSRIVISENGVAQITSFNEKDGLLSTYYQTLKLEQQRNGTIWGLSTMGMFSFHPDSIQQNRLAPVILLGQQTVPDKFSKDIAIYSYKNNTITFDFTAVSLSDPSKIRYRYRLTGIDSNWRTTTERTITLNNLAPGSYKMEMMASNNSNVWTPAPIQYSFIIEPPFWKSNWFRAFSVVLISGLVYFLFRRRINNIRERAAIKHQMAELEGKALRAQMNPHFIFNSLNAIQKLIVIQDMDASYNYLSKFSKLLRLVLDNSDKNFISLSQELEMNKLYLELESLRFKNSFQYYIKLNQQTDPDILLIPSLLLQPFIENAIWHGLMHKDGDKKLEINFTEDTQYLVCSIEDNGIGREKSAAIKSQKLGAHYFESKGTQLSQQRIKLLTDAGNETAVSYIDLKNPDGSAAGTRVDIKIPLQKIK
jgi:ligand-binding sensor domain-containing protein/two-component sensor histidine kinase